MRIIQGCKYFATQKEDEEVLILARRHWVVYLPSIFGAIFVLFLCLLAYFNLDSVGFFRNNEVFKAVASCIISAILLFTSLFVYITWLVNYLNSQIVTNQHVVDIDQSGLFSRKISELCLEDIEDVSATQNGLLQSFLRYGTVTAQTAGEKPNFIFEKVKNPYDISRQIVDIKDNYGSERVTEVPGNEQVTEPGSGQGPNEV